MIPDHDTVKQFMNEVYNGFYLKWREILTTENSANMMNDVYALEKKYGQYELFKTIILCLIECIEEAYRRRLQ
jgi:hypothetical protein